MLPQFIANSSKAFATQDAFKNWLYAMRLTPGISSKLSSHMLVASRHTAHLIVWILSLMSVRYYKKGGKGFLKAENIAKNSMYAFS